MLTVLVSLSAITPNAQAEQTHQCLGFLGLIQKTPSGAPMSFLVQEHQALVVAELRNAGFNAFAVESKRDKADFWLVGRIIELE